MLLFFIDYKALLTCFTISLFSISSSNLIEKILFEKEQLSFHLVLQFIMPTLILGLIFIVSCKAFIRVYFFTTFIKCFLLSLLLVSISMYLNFGKITKGIENVQGFTSKMVWISGGNGVSREE